MIAACRFPADRSGNTAVATNRAKAELWPCS